MLLQAAVWVQLLIASALLSACESAEDSVRTEIVPLAKGEYHGARWGGTQVERSTRWRGVARPMRELILADGSLERVVRRVPNALSSRFSFVMGGKALGLVYLDDVDPDSLLGRLQLQLVSGNPTRSALGDDPGIRFARIDIPCQTTSDAPWACGF